MRIRRTVFPAAVVTAALTLLLYLIYDTPTHYDHDIKADDSVRGRLPRGQDSNPDPVRKVILLSQARSGSSLAGNILSHSADVFYVFEPLREAERVEDSWHSTFVGRARHILRSYLTCRLGDLDPSDLGDQFPDHFNTTRGLAECRRNGDETCLREFERRCNQSKVKVLKVARLRILDVEPLLIQYSDLAVVLMVRDPRAFTWSWVQMHRTSFAAGDNTSSFVHSECNGLDDNVRAAEELGHRYPGRVKALRYESLAENPVNMSRELYEFLGGLQWNERVETLVRSQTSSQMAKAKKKFAKLAQKRTFFKPPTLRPPFKIPSKRSFFNVLPRHSFFGGPQNLRQDILNSFPALPPSQSGVKKSHESALSVPDPYSVVSADSSQAVHAWRQEVDWNFVKTAQEKCFSVMRQLGYRLFHLEEDLRDDPASQRAFDRAEVMLDDGVLLE